MSIAQPIPVAPAAKKRAGQLLLPLLAAAIVAGIYGVSSISNQFVYDDHEVIENQPPIHHFRDLASIFREPHYLNFPYYRPITRLTFALQKTIWGNNPRPYHLFNALLAGLVMLSAYALLRRPGFALSAAAALLAATWFALHPAFSECVYPAASGRETLLPMLMILLASWAYLGASRRSYWLAMVLTAGALLCKEQAAVLPGIFVLIDLLALAPRRPRTAAGWIIRYVPILCIFAGYFLARHVVLGATPLRLAITEHPLDPFKSLLYGVQTGVTPFKELRYEPTWAAWFDWRLSALALAAIAVMLALAGCAARTVRRAAIFWIGWFVLLQLPMAHILVQEADYSERYAALAILALPALAGAAIGYWLTSRRRWLAGAIGWLWVALFGAVSFWRGSYYTNDISFCIRWVQTDPDSPGPHNGLGLIAQQQRDWRTAIEEYDKALQIEPDDAMAHNNLANLLADRGDYAAATAHYQWLLHHPGAGADPAATMTDYAQMLGMLAWQTHNPAMRDKAHQLLIDAIDLRPRYAPAHDVLGDWHYAFGSRAEAIRQWNFALDLRPDWPTVRAKLKKLVETPATRH